MDSGHELTSRTESVLKEAMAKGIQIVLATGKTRGSAMGVIERLGLTTPGVYLQGLALYNGDGTVLSQEYLNPALARQAITFAEDRGFTAVAYAGLRVLVRRYNADTDKLVLFHEPKPEVVGALQNVLDTMAINKVIFISKDESRRVRALRWQLSMQINGAGRLVQALDDMLELLPVGNSKGNGLKKLLAYMNIPFENVLAIGDGENDIEMIQMAGIGVAMGNAIPKLKEVANYVAASNDEDGVAEAVERFVLQPLAEEERARKAAEEAAKSLEPASAIEHPDSANKSEDTKQES